VLCHTTVSGDVVFEDGSTTVTVVKPTAVREEAPVRLKEGTTQFVEKLLQDFSEQFGELAPTADVRQKALRQCIETDPKARIPNAPLRRYNPAELGEIKSQIDNMLQQGIISPSTSPYGSPILMIKKKSGGWRICLDCRARNSITRKNAAPLPRIDDLLDRLEGANYFGSLDLPQGYYQRGLRDKDREKTAFKRVWGLYEFNTLKMGLMNAPSMFQTMMNKTFEGLHGCVIIYLDDILVFSKTEEDHIRDLRLVLERIKLAGLVAKRSKCAYFVPSLNLLGHVVSDQSISPDSIKVQVIKDWPRPTDQRQLRGFLGLANHFRELMQGYSLKAAPLEKLTGKLGSKKNSLIVWTPECEVAFLALKEDLCHTPCMVLPDYKKPFKLVCDASNTGIGGVLLQDERPIAFISKRFNKAQKNYHTTDREVLAAVHCLKEWRVYMTSVAKEGDTKNNFFLTLL
jgi:hypothetical protein